jgi:formylglycine-generating enzyme required for sulfatase activity
VKVEFVTLPGGEFLMGSSLAEIADCVAYWGTRLVEPSYDAARLRQWLLKEYPRHPVCVAPFRMGRFPVTNAQYRAFIRATGGVPPESLREGEPDDHPVWGVSAGEALAYADWLSGRIGAICRLPSEAEWEYAARGPAGSTYPFGDAFDPACCNTVESGIGHTTPVDGFPRGVSGFGLYDMAGNVEEWTADHYAPYPGGTFVDDDLSRGLGRYRVLRGGSFARGGDLARCARRHGPAPGPAFRYRGFRLAQDIRTVAHPAPRDPSMR